MIKSPFAEFQVWELGLGALLESVGLVCLLFQCFGLPANEADLMMVERADITLEVLGARTTVRALNQCWHMNPIVGWRMRVMALS